MITNLKPQPQVAAFPDPLPTEGGRPEENPLPTEGGGPEEDPLLTESWVPEEDPLPTKGGGPEEDPAPTEGGRQEWDPLPTEGGVPEEDPFLTKGGGIVHSVINCIIRSLLNCSLNNTERCWKEAEDPSHTWIITEISNSPQYPQLGTLKSVSVIPKDAEKYRKVPIAF